MRADGDAGFSLLCLPPVSMKRRCEGTFRGLSVSDWGCWLPPSWGGRSAVPPPQGEGEQETSSRPLENTAGGRFKDPRAACHVDPLPRRSRPGSSQAAAMLPLPPTGPRLPRTHVCGNFVPSLPPPPLKGDSVRWLTVPPGSPHGWCSVWEARRTQRRDPVSLTDSTAAILCV